MSTPKIIPILTAEEAFAATNLVIQKREEREQKEKDKRRTQFLKNVNAFLTKELSNLIKKRAKEYGDFSIPCYNYEHILVSRAYSQESKEEFNIVKQKVQETLEPLGYTNICLTENPYYLSFDWKKPLSVDRV